MVIKFQKFHRFSIFIEYKKNFLSSLLQNFPFKTSDLSLRLMKKDENLMSEHASSSLSLVQEEQLLSDDERIQRQLKIIDFWTTIEILTPQNPPKDRDQSDKIKLFLIEDFNEALPFEDEHPHLQEALLGQTKWLYSIFLGEGFLKAAIKDIADAFQIDTRFHETNNFEKYAIFSLCVDDQGYLLMDSFVISSFAWVCGVLQNKKETPDKGVIEFLKAKKELEEIYSIFCDDYMMQSRKDQSSTIKDNTEDPSPILETKRIRVNGQFLSDLFNTMRSAMNLETVSIQPSLYVVAHKIEDPESIQEIPGILNSFFLNDLERLRKNCLEKRMNDITAQYLTQKIDLNKRIDVRRSPQVYHQLLNPGAYPRGCWPTKGLKPLVFSQQATINAFFSTEPEKKGTVFSINGPPGTGKTTLLRDMIAHIIVERAEKMVTFENPKDAFKRYFDDTGEIPQRFLTVDPCLCGLEIVVTSSNNAAVENISLEIPTSSAIDFSYKEQSDYFQSFAQKLLGPQYDAWGLIAARLGNKANRVSFIRKFWLDDIQMRDKDTPLTKLISQKPDDGKGFEGYLKTLQTAYSEEESFHLWNTTVDDFKKALEEEDQLRLKKQGIFEKNNKKQAQGEQSPDLPLFLSDPADASSIELSSPWMDEEWFKARSQVFMKAIEVHKVFVQLNAASFRVNLKQLMLYLAGDTGIAHDEMIQLFRTLFLLIPVVSTTLASFSRLFSGLPSDFLGYVFVDEAAQVLPQAAVSALFYAKNALFLGDPKQIEPVHVLDRKIQTGIAKHLQVPSLWVPCLHSAQGLADRVNLLGTYLYDSWTGMPLRVHRRCDKLIFDISNDLAYDHMMIYGTPERELLTLPPSQWFHVGVHHAKSNWIPEEGETLITLLERLQNELISMENVFVISPFRDVVFHLKPLVKKYGVLVSTIHRAQGKEYDIVILVLGSRPQVSGGRSWATEKPNLFNVAVSRARRRLYVIGNRYAWSKHPYSSTIARYLAEFEQP